MTNKTEALPPLPEPEARFSVDSSGRWKENLYGNSGLPMFTAEHMQAYARATLAQRQQVPAQPRLTVRLTSFPESNGKRNWTALLVRVDPWGGLIGNCGGITIDRGELWNRVAYAAECARALIGERDTEPHILDYGDDIKTPEEWTGEVRGGRVALTTAPPAQPSEPAAEAQEPVAWMWESPGYKQPHLNGPYEGVPAFWKITPLYTAQPQKAALTAAQRRRLWNNSPEIHPDAKSYAAFERILQLVERAHGIEQRGEQP